MSPPSTSRRCSRSRFDDGKSYCVLSQLALSYPYKAFQKLTDLIMDVDVAAATGDGTARKLLKAVGEFHMYIDRNIRAFIPNYGERYRYGERISTGFVESTVNQVISKRFCKKQQMPWTSGRICCCKRG